MSAGCFKRAEASLLSASVNRPSGRHNFVAIQNRRGLAALHPARFVRSTRSQVRPVPLIHARASERQREQPIQTAVARPQQDAEMSNLTPQLTLTCLLAFGAILLLPASPALAHSFGASEYDAATDLVAIERWLIGTTPALGYLYFKNVVLKREPDKIFIKDQVYLALSLYSLGLIVVALVWWRPEYYSRTGTTGIF